jgi:hypothetical protein
MLHLKYELTGGILYQNVGIKSHICTSLIATRLSANRELGRQQSAVARKVRLLPVLLVANCPVLAAFK